MLQELHKIMYITNQMLSACVLSTNLACWSLKLHSQNSLKVKRVPLQWQVWVFALEHDHPVSPADECNWWRGDQIHLSNKVFVNRSLFNGTQQSVNQDYHSKYDINISLCMLRCLSICNVTKIPVLLNNAFVGMVRTSKETITHSRGFLW